MSYLSAPAARFLCVVSLVILSNSGFSQAATQGWDRFQFTGNATFSAEQLRNALIAEPDFLLATHPHSDRADIATVTRRLLLAGYRDAGFKSPQVEVELQAEGGVTVRIAEGQRFRCGRVTINGADQVDVQQLTKRLTKPFAKENTFPTFVEAHGKTITRWVDDKGKLVSPEKPVWKLGTPAEFDRETKLSKSVKAALKDIGFSAAKFNVSVISNDVDLSAELVVDILDEGPQDRADIFKIVGSDVNAPKDVKEFLELTPCVAIDLVQIQRLTKKLWDCGRFTTHHLHFDRDESGAGRLNIELADVPGVPRLTEPLSQTAEVFLRARTWLNGIDERGDDLSFTFIKAGCRMQFVQSQQGLLVQVIAPAKATADGKASGGLRTVFMVDQTGVTISNSSSPDLWKGEIRQFKGSIRLETKFSAAKSDDDFGTITFSASTHSERADDEPAIAHVLNLSPSDWSAFAYKRNLESKIENGRLHVFRDTDHLEIDIASGEVLSWGSETSESLLQTGLFEQLRNEIARETAGKPNLYQPARPLTSLVTYMISGPSWDSINQIRQLTNPEGNKLDPHLRSGLDKLVTGGLLLPLDTFINYSVKSQSGEQFSIPDESAPHSDYKRWALALVGKYTLKCAPELFAEGTWPMTVTREACLVMVDRGQHTGKVLNELQADESTGPLCNASVAYLLSLIHQPIATKFATSSLEKMEPTEFDRDISVLLSGPCGQWIDGMLGAITSLSPAETAALGKSSSNDKLTSTLRALQNQATPPAGNESVWYQAAREQLQVILGGIQQR